MGISIRRSLGSLAGSDGVDPRMLRSLLLELLSDVDTRVCWQLAEQATDASPHAMQPLLDQAVRDADRVRDDVRSHVSSWTKGDLKKASRPLGPAPVHRHSRADRQRIDCNVLA